MRMINAKCNKSRGNIMKWNLFPKLQVPDYKKWNACFPEQVGPSIFSSPAWQKLMCLEMGAEWRLLFLTTFNPDHKSISIPVFVRKGNWGRVEIQVRPVGYYVTPIETCSTEEHVIKEVLNCARAPFTAGFTWTLPPWSNWKSPKAYRHRLFAQQDIDYTETYIIRLKGSYEEHMSCEVSDTPKRHLRRTYDRGLEVIESPTTDQVDEYYELYSRVWAEEQWIGPKFMREFFMGRRILWKKVGSWY